MRAAAVAMALAATASSAAAQSVAVFTNVVDGQRVDRIVRAERAHQPAAPIPLSITTTEVLPRNYKRPLGPTSYTPPASVVHSHIPPPKPQPSFINGIYAGPSLSGNWTAISIGRPIIDVNIVGRPKALIR
jgi:hypothetical protein